MAPHPHTTAGGSVSVQILLHLDRGRGVHLHAARLPRRSLQRMEALRSSLQTRPCARAAGCATPAGSWQIPLQLSLAGFCSFNLETFPISHIIHPQIPHCHCILVTHRDLESTYFSGTRGAHRKACCNAGKKQQSPRPYWERSQLSKQGCKYLLNFVGNTKSTGA